MSERIVPQRVVVSRPPRFNFSAFLSGIMIPRCVAECRKLSPGARLLWGVIRNLSKRDGHCDASDRTLSKRIAVSIRQIKRYCRQLERGGWMETELREAVTARRYLLLHHSFTVSSPVPRDTSVTGGCHIGHGGVTDMSPHTMEKNLSVVEQSIKVYDSGRPAGRAAAGLQRAADFLDGFFPEAEVKAIRREVESLGFRLTPDLLAKLRNKGEHYGVGGFVIAAHIARAAKVIARQPSNKPKSPAWFCTVVENALNQGNKPT
jgi:hypothetical protein